MIAHVLGLIAALTLATAPAPTSPRIDAKSRRALVDVLSRQIQSRYVFPDSASRIQAFLKKRVASGAYDTAATAAVLGRLLTDDLRTFDLHFDVRFDTERAAALRASGSDTARVLPDLDPTPDSLAGMRRDNFAFRSATLLPGNVAYLKVDFFHDLRFARPTAEAAIDFLANGDAMIVDLRECPGGYGSMVDFLVSAFLGADSVKLLTSFDRELGVTQQAWSHPAIASRHLPDVTLYLLTSTRTGSAAEALAFTLQAISRATVVGERSAGAAHRGGWVPLRDGFVAFIPNARAFDPRTGRDWERTGIQPDVGVPAARALDAAHATAVRQLAGRERDPRRVSELQWLLPLLERQAAGALAPPDSVLERYVGAYERCTITLKPDGFFFVGASGVPQRLVPLSEDTFVLEDERFTPEHQIRVRFPRDPNGAIASLQLLVDDGRVLTRRRVGN